MAIGPSDRIARNEYDIDEVHADEIVLLAFMSARKTPRACTPEYLTGIGLRLKDTFGRTTNIT